tara:strand:+ start:281 stop:673 length:393 start_codon:yes stop_codon:yes gene_type:complete
MTDETLLIDYQHFVDEVTSDASKDPDAFGDALDIIDEFGVPPERLITAAMGLSAESGEFTEIVKKCLFQGKPMDEHTIWHAKRELGDILWYLVQGCIALDTIWRKLYILIQRNLNPVILMGLIRFVLKTE